MVNINPDLITDDMMYEGIHDPRTSDGRPLVEHVREDKLWGEIRLAARTNPTLQEALNQCIMIYKLSKDYNNGI